MRGNCQPGCFMWCRPPFSKTVSVRQRGPGQVLHQGSHFIHSIILTDGTFNRRRFSDGCGRSPIVDFGLSLGGEGERWRRGHIYPAEQCQQTQMDVVEYLSIQIMFLTKILIHFNYRNYSKISKQRGIVQIRFCAVPVMSSDQWDSYMFNACQKKLISL